MKLVKRDLTIIPIGDECGYSNSEMKMWIKCPYLEYRMLDHSGPNIYGYCILNRVILSNLAKICGVP